MEKKMPSRKPRRSWTALQKREIVMEARATSFTKTAQKHRLQPNQIRAWESGMISEFGKSNKEITEEKLYEIIGRLYVQQFK